MAKITYEFYSEKYADLVAELMRNNKFWVGRFDEYLTGEKFIDYQRKRGIIFGIIGRLDEKAVSYVGTYETAGQKVASEKQAFISGLIIDQKYRTSVFSIMDMFSMLMKELISLGYSDIIADVDKFNYPSFYLMRKCGFVILDKNLNVYGDYILHSYLPGIVKMANHTEYVDSSFLPEVMQKFDKKQLYHVEQIIDNRFIQIEGRAQDHKCLLLIDILSGRVAGVQDYNLKFKIWPKNAKFRQYIFKNYDINTRKIYVNFWEDDRFVSEETFEKDFAVVNIPQNVTKITFEVENCSDTYYFYISEMLKYRCKIEEKSIELGEFSFEERSAFLSFGKNSDGIPMFKEMWPHVCIPYIEGILIPNYRKNITTKRIDANCILATEKTDDCIIYRKYTVYGNRIEIHTKAKLLSDKPAQPMFQLAFYDLSYNCNIYLDDETVAVRRYEPDDINHVTEEMMFLDFLKYDYSAKNFEKIEISFDSVPDLKFVIRTEKEARCFCQLNYFGIEYDRKVYEGKDKIDFGIISVEKINNFNRQYCEEYILY